MGYLASSFAQLLGRAPKKPAREAISVEAWKIQEYKRANKITLAKLDAVRHANRERGEHRKWLQRRWATLIVINLLFVVSYHFDVQLVEGALTASRVVGFHFADLNSALQVTLAYKHLVLNLLIGTATVFTLWLLVGGRSFCSWACPYHLLSEWAEMLHLWLVRKKWIKGRTFFRGIRSISWVVFGLLAVLTGYTVFETISPTGIVSRALIYGPGLALIWVAVLLAFEILVSRRAWCRYLCPIGFTYGIVGLLSPLRVVYSPDQCYYGGDCRKVCLVPHVLDATILGHARDVSVPLGADCTRCGMCIDACPSKALKFEVKGLNRVL